MVLAEQQAYIDIKCLKNERASKYFDIADGAWFVVFNLLAPRQGKRQGEIIEVLVVTDLFQLCVEYLLMKRN